MPLFTLELLGDTAGTGGQAIDRKQQRAVSLADAIQTATYLATKAAPAGTTGYRLLDQYGNVVHRWHKREQQPTETAQAPAPRPAESASDGAPIAANPQTAPGEDKAPKLNVVKSNLRVLVPGEEAPLEIHLSRHWTSSLLLRANLRVGGLRDEGQPGQGTYAAAWEGATILGVAAHYWNGILVVQAQRALDQVVRMAVASSKRPLSGIMGPWPQVEAAVAALGVPPRRRTGGKAQILMTLDLAKLQPPEASKRNEARHRLARPTDIEHLTALRAPRDAAILGVSDSAQHRNALSAALAQQVAAGVVFIAETTQTNRIVAMASLEASLTDSVQIGNACALPTPKDQKDKGYAAVAVAGAIAAAQARDIKRIVLLADKSPSSAVTAFRSVGFTATDDFGLFNIAPVQHD